MLRILALLVLLLINKSLEAQSYDLAVRGSITLRGSRGAGWDSVFIFDDGKLISKYKQVVIPNHKIQLFGWLPNQNLSIATVTHTPKNSPMSCVSTVLFNQKGVIVDTVYIVSEGDWISSALLSPNGKLLLMSLKYSRNPDPPEFQLWNLEKRMMVAKLPALSTHHLSVTSWSPDSKSFAYSHPKKGVFNYNIETNESQLISEDGDMAEWSPTMNHIAYQIGEELFVYDTKEKTRRKLWGPKVWEALLWMEWTHDGQDILLYADREYFNIFPLYSSYSYLINVNTGIAKRNR